MGPPLLEHLFRHEAGRLTAAVTRVLGLHNLGLAEDVVHDAFVSALESWKLRGPPDNPAAWLASAARHRAIDLIRRERTRLRFAPDLGERLAAELEPTVAACFFDGEVRDGQLRLMFALCDERLSQPTQVLIMLKLLGGFGVPELAHVFLSREAAIEKRLVRARATLAEAGALAEIPSGEALAARVSAVAEALYLMFSEGYHGAHPEAVVREEVCREALRLAIELASHPTASLPEVHALVALMCFLLARLPTRLDEAGRLVPLEEQDRARWDQDLVSRGFAAFKRSAAGDVVTAFHVESAIAAHHTAAASVAQTDWTAVSRLYDRLLALRPTPIVALAAAVARGQAEGPDAGLAALADLRGSPELEAYPFLPAAEADLERRAGRLERARIAYAQALERARNPAEREFFQRRIAGCSRDRDTMAT